METCYRLWRECPICGLQGKPIVVKQADTMQLMVMCDECQSVFVHPDDLGDERRATDPFSLGSKVKFEVVPATKSDIVEGGWWSFVEPTPVPW